MDSSVTKDGAPVDHILFTNLYTPPEKPIDPPSVKPVSITLAAEKQLKGGKLSNGQFSFELLDGADKVYRTAKNDAEGRIVFNSIRFTRTGTFVFTLREKQDGQKNIAYDTATFRARVAVTEHDGQLQAQVRWSKADVAADPIFFNKVTIPPTGDSTPLLIAGLAALSLLSLGAVYVLRKQKATRKPEEE